MSVKNSIGILIFILGCCLLGCRADASMSGEKEVVFFDLKNFIQNEAHRLNEIKPNIKKTTRVNETVETKEVSIENFETELKIFSDVDINKIAWQDKYSADTSYVGANISSIQYIALDERLLTRKMKVIFTDQAVSKIEALTSAKSLVTDVQKTLIYEPNVSYSILSKQSTSMSEENEIEIKGLFIGLSGGQKE